MTPEEEQRREWKLKYNSSWLKYMRGDRLLRFIFTREGLDPTAWNPL